MNRDDLLIRIADKATRTAREEGKKAHRMAQIHWVVTEAHIEAARRAWNRAANHYAEASQAARAAACRERAKCYGPGGKVYNSLKSISARAMS